MSRIAILSDIHGNSTALAAVLDDIKRQKIDECFILGDFVGYYYHPREVLQLLQESGLACARIRGNHERMLERALRGGILWEDIRRKYGSGLEIAARELPEDTLAELLSLPDERLEEHGGRRFLLCHGAPGDVDRYIYPDAPPETFDFSDVAADYILLGHTHYPMLRFREKYCVVNPGSVGQARTRGGVADWCVINTDNDVVTMRQTPYDVDAVICDCLRYDADVPYLQEVLRR